MSNFTPPAAREWDSLGHLLNRPQWMQHAACAGIGTDRFYPPRGTASGCDGYDGVTICRTCPVQPDCLEHGVQHELHGWWGGVSPRELRRIRRDRGIAVTTLEPLDTTPQCGTEHGYRRHLRRGEPSCAPCRDAASRRRSRARGAA